MSKGATGAANMLSEQSVGMCGGVIYSVERIVLHIERRNSALPSMVEQLDGSLLLSTWRAVPRNVCDGSVVYCFGRMVLRIGRRNNTLSSMGEQLDGSLLLSTLACCPFERSSGVE